MKSVRNSGLDRPAGKLKLAARASTPRIPRPHGLQPPRHGRPVDRKEAYVLIAIALLFVANVVLYLCHHYGLTSLNELHAFHHHASPQVMIDGSYVTPS